MSRTNNEITQNSKSEPKKFSILCTFKATGQVIHEPLELQATFILEPLDLQATWYLSRWSYRPRDTWAARATDHVILEPLELHILKKSKNDQHSCSVWTIPFCQTIIPWPHRKQIQDRETIKCIENLFFDNCFVFWFGKLQKFCTREKERLLTPPPPPPAVVLQLCSVCGAKIFRTRGSQFVHKKYTMAAILKYLDRISTHVLKRHSQLCKFLEKDIVIY